MSTVIPVADFAELSTDDLMSIDGGCCLIWLCWPKICLPKICLPNKNCDNHNTTPVTPVTPVLP